MTYPHADKQAALRDLKAVHAARGEVPAALVREIAADIGCTERTVWNWWAQHRNGAGAAAKQPQARLTEEQIEVVFATGGNVSAAHRHLINDADTAVSAPSRRTLARWWSQEDSAIRAFASDGATGLMNKQMRVRHTVDERNQLWRIDHQEFPVWVLPAGRSSTPVKPWVTTIIDDRTRYLLAVLVTVERADATAVTVALADAIRIKDTVLPHVQVGGVPLALGYDNGGELRSEQVQTMLRRLGIASRRTFPYMKHLNGKVERVQQTMQNELGQRLPGFAGGPKTLKLRNLYGLDGDLLTEELFTELLLAWTEEYNTERTHQALEGRTPLQEWAAEHTPLRKPDMEMVRLAMMLEAEPRKVTTDGVSFKSQMYGSGELAALRIVDQDVTLRYLPHDDTFVEVFDGDRWLCTAVKSHKLDADGRALMRQVQKDQYRTARAFAEAARQRRKLAAATATVDQPHLASLGATPTSLLVGGDDELLQLSERPANAAPSPIDAHMVIDVGHRAVDPWELGSSDDEQSSPAHPL